MLVEEGATTDRLHVVAQGWLAASVGGRAGGRRIVRFHFDDDLAGPGAAARRARATLSAVTDTFVDEVPLSALAALFEAHPRVAAAFHAAASADHLQLLERMMSLADASGLARVASVLLEVRDGLGRRADPAAGFELPLTQAAIGEATGLSKEHVNRLLRRLEAAGLVERQGRRVRLPKPEPLRALAARGSARDAADGASPVSTSPGGDR